MKEEKNHSFARIRRVTLAYVNAMKTGGEPGIYAKERGEAPGLYGSYHAAHVLDLFGELGSLGTDHLAAWGAFFKARQSEQGFFTNDPELLTARLSGAELNPVWHTTRGCLWALRVLNEAAERPLLFLQPFRKSGALRFWVLGYDWSQPWAASNQVLAMVTALFAQRDWFGDDSIDAQLASELQPALHELLDESTGLWGTQFGAGVADGLFANIHLMPIYFACGWPLPAVERMVDATLSAQLPDGSYWPGGSDCPDFDGAYMLANLYELTDYRRAEMEIAARRYLAHALQHEDPDGCGWLLHRRDTPPHGWKARPHWKWPAGATRAVAEQRDENPRRTHIMLGSWFYPLSIALIANMLGDTGYEGPYRINGHSLHQCNVFNGTRTITLCNERHS